MNLRQLAEKLSGDDMHFMPGWIIDSLVKRGNTLPDWFGPGEGLPDLPPEVLKLERDAALLRSGTPAGAAALLGAVDFAHERAI